MYIYNDESESESYIPSDIYMQIPDFSQILEAISIGKIPTGTGNPFPIYSTQAREASISGDVPWYNDGGLKL